MKDRVRSSGRQPREGQGRSLPGDQGGGGDQGDAGRCRFPAERFENSFRERRVHHDPPVPVGGDLRIAVPAVADTYTRRDALELLEKRTVVIFAGGTGNPYFTTDTAAALKATEVNAKLILMAKNGVDGVYSSDPKTNKDAVRFNEMTYDEILANNLKVMDLTAATLCNQNKISMVIFDMNVKGNIKRAYENPEIGTIIKSK